jgi:hypothetical protein
MLAALLRNSRLAGWHIGVRASQQIVAAQQQPEEKVSDSVTVMNEQIKQAIRTRASQARSQAEVADAIFTTLREYRIDVKHVSLEEMKRAVVDATRAAREETDNGSLPV